MAASVTDVYIGNDCTDASLGPDDTCIIHCDESKQKDISFSCGNAGQCIFQCEEKKCMEKGFLNAKNTRNLTVISSGSECLKKATVSLPDFGDARFRMANSKSFKEMVINSGSNTQNVFVDCTYGSGDECSDLTINAQTAQFLEIKVGSNSELEGNSGPAIINCPQNSLYNDTALASCIIDVSEGGRLRYVTINTLNGTPNDVWIKTGNTELSQVQITCENGISNNFGNSFINQGACWMPDRTSNPSLGPTVSPTLSPSIKPTLNPTVTPTKGPAVVKSITKLSSTTDTPHAVTSLTSSTESLYVEQITSTPILMNSETLILSDQNIADTLTESLWWESDVVIYGLLGGFLAICVCVFGIYCCIKRCKNRSDNDHIIHYKIQSNSSKHTVNIKLNAFSKRGHHNQVPTLSPHGSQDTIIGSSERVELNMIESMDGCDAFGIACENPLEEGHSGDDEETTTMQRFEDEYYEEIDLDDDEDDDLNVTHDIDDANDEALELSYAARSGYY